MSYQSDLTTALAAAAGITGITGTRIYADVADGSTAAPYLVWQVISTGGETTHDGVRNIEFPTIQFSCWATGKAGAIALASAVNAVLDGNTISGSSGLTFQFNNQFGTYDPDTKLFGEILEYRASCSIN
jgi:hypothetical protein